MKIRHDIFHLWRCLLAKELKAKYKGTVFGYAWSILIPFLQSIIYYCVFSVFLRFNIKDYFLYLFTGCMVWQFFSNVLLQGANSMICNANLIRKTTAPRWIFVLSSFSAEAVHLLLSIPVVLLLMFYCGRTPQIQSLWLFPLALLSLGTLSLGMTLAVAGVNAYFRDLERILQILLQVWFYATPIFYALDFVPEKYHTLIRLNPAYAPIALFRSVFYGPEAGGKTGLLASAAGLAVLFCGILCFRRMQKRLAEVV